MRPSRYRGYAAVLALLLLFLGTTLSAWLYAILQNATAISRNEQSAVRTEMVSESGLAYMQIKLHEVFQQKSIPLSSDDAEMLLAVGNALAEQFPAGQVTITDSVPPEVHIASTGVKGGAFTASLAMSKTYEHGFNLGVTGTAGAVSSNIGVEYEFGVNGLDPWGSYGMLSHGQMVVPTTPSGVFHWDNEKGMADSSPGNAVQVPAQDASSGWALTFDGATPPSGLKFPPKYLPDGGTPGEADLYAKLDSMIGSSLPRFVAMATDKKGTPAPFTSCYIPPNTPVTFKDGATLTGLIYVGYPNTLKFEGNVAVNAVIIYEKPQSNELDAKSSIDLSRTIAMTSNPAAAQDAVDALFVKSGETLEKAMAYSDMISPWTIHAPDTDLNLQEGNTDRLDLWGSLHIRNILKSAGNGTGSQNKYVFHGTIVCEGEVDLRGNRKFSVSPQNENPPPRAPKFLALAPRPGGYWENRP